MRRLPAPRDAPRLSPNISTLETLSCLCPSSTPLLKEPLPRHGADNTIEDDLPYNNSSEAADAFCRPLGPDEVLEATQIGNLEPMGRPTLETPSRLCPSYKALLQNPPGDAMAEQTKDTPSLVRSASGDNGWQNWTCNAVEASSLKPTNLDQMFAYSPPRDIMRRQTSPSPPPPPFPPPPLPVEASSLKPTYTLLDQMFAYLPPRDIMRREPSRSPPPPPPPPLIPSPPRTPAEHRQLPMSINEEDLGALDFDALMEESNEAIRRELGIRCFISLSLPLSLSLPRLSCGEPVCTFSLTHAHTHIPQRQGRD